MRVATKKFSSVAELVGKLIKDVKACDGPVWYRGQADKKWKLLPSMVRENRATEEMKLLKQFKQNATLLISPRPNESIDWLFIMQHHGVPTRLLDWTESPLMAAYFAAYEEKNVDGAVWALMPMELNKQANVADIPSFDEDIILMSYLPETLSSETGSKLLPLAIIAPRNNPRMQSQLSVFTISHRDDTPIEKIGKREHIWRYILPKEAKERVLRELEVLGIGRFQLFPELQSIGDILRGK